MMTSEQFNSQYPLGTKVRYEPVLGRGHSHATATRSQAWDMCGSVIVKVNGVSGGVDIGHLTEI